MSPPAPPPPRSLGNDDVRGRRKENKRRSGRSRTMSERRVI